MLVKLVPFLLEKCLMPSIYILLKSVFHFKIKGLEHLQQLRKQPFILAGSHTGWLDIPMLLSANKGVHPLTFMVSEEVFHYPLVGNIVKFANTLPVAPNKELATLKALIKRLQAGDPIVIFPEGKLTETGELGTFQTGVGFLQRKTQVPIVPFAITGGFQAWGYPQRYPRLFSPIILTFGSPLVYNKTLTDKAVTQQLRTVVATLQATA
jgi:1-acyl-sn-glycerol-3-phosphate acyltransferase